MLLASCPECIGGTHAGALDRALRTLCRSPALHGTWGTSSELQTLALDTGCSTHDSGSRPRSAHLRSAAGVGESRTWCRSRPNPAVPGCELLHRGRMLHSPATNTSNTAENWGCHPQEAFHLFAIAPFVRVQVRRFLCTASRPKNPGAATGTSDMVESRLPTLRL